MIDIAGTDQSMNASHGASTTLHPDGLFSTRNWFLAVCIVAFLAVVVSCIFKDRMLYGGNMPKYIVSISLFKTLICFESREELMTRIKDVRGALPSNEEYGLGTAISDQRPLWFIMMALLSIHNDIPVVESLVLSMLLLAISAQLLLWVFVRNRNPFLWLAGILSLSPFVLYQCWVWEPHILQLFFISMGLFLYTQSRTIPSFYFLALSIGAHPGSIPFVVCVGIHLLATKERRVWIHGFLGGVLGLTTIEFILAILFWADQDGLVPHTFFLETFFTVSERASGGFAKAPGLLHFSRVILMYFPLTFFGFFSIRRWENLLLIVGPLLLFFLIGKGSMPGAHRVLLPLYVMAALLFVSHLGIAHRWSHRWLRTAICVLAMLVTVSYCVTATLGDTIRFKGKIALKIDSIVNKDPIAAPLYHWNFRRFGPVQANAKMVCHIVPRKSNDIVPPFVPHPYPIYHYWYACVRHLWSDKVEMRLAGSAASLDVQMRKSLSDASVTGDESKADDI